MLFLNELQLICLHIVKWFQVLLLTQIIPHKRLNSSIGSINRTLTVTTTPSQSGPGSNGNEGVLHIFQDLSLIIRWVSGISGTLINPQRRCSWYILQFLPTGEVFVEIQQWKPYSSVILFTNPSTRAGYDTRSIFKRSLTGLNSEFSFS